MRCNLNDKVVHQWSQEHVAPPPRWADLTHDQKVFLAAWYILAIAEPPPYYEELPVNLYRAVEELAGTGRQALPRRFLRQRVTSRQVGNKRRIVRARKKRYELA